MLHNMIDLDNNERQQQPKKKWQREQKQTNFSYPNTLYLSFMTWQKQ